MTTEREAFEAWYRPGLLFEPSKPCGYSNSHQNACWIAWQAARADLARQEPDGMLHDDGYFTWTSQSNQARHHSQYAGWKVPFYILPHPTNRDSIIEECAAKCDALETQFKHRSNGQLSAMGETTCRIIAGAYEEAAKAIRALKGKS